MWKKLLSTFLLVSFCFSLLTAQSVQNNLSTLEDTLIQLENNLSEQQNIIANLEKDLETSKQMQQNLENLQTEMSVQLESASNSLKKSELELKRWKIAFAVGVPVTAITAIGITCLVLNSK